MNAEHKSVPRGSGRPTAQTALKSWIRRQFRAWPIIRHLCAERDNLQRINEHLLANHVANSQVNKHLLADQAKIKADNEWLLAEQSAIRALNDYLEREQDWLKTANQRLQAEFQETKQLTPLGRSEKKDQPMAPGMISNFDIEAITDLAKKVPAGGIIVDIGSLLGRSATLWCIHSTAARIVCIDPWQYEPWMESFCNANGEPTKEVFLANVRDPRVETIQGYSPSCAEGWTMPVDLYWEDGDHINPGCADSIRFWSGHVKPGGIACGHDYHLPDVKSEADALADRWGAKLHLHGTVWWVRRIRCERTGAGLRKPTQPRSLTPTGRR